MTLRITAAIAGFTLASIVFPAPLSAQMLTLGEAKEALSANRPGALTARAQTGAMAFYLQGMAEGVMSYHGRLEAAGAPLFCPPKGRPSSLSLQEISAMITSAPHARAGEPVAAIFLDGLKAKYPCAS